MNSKKQKVTGQEPQLSRREASQISRSMNPPGLGGDMGVMHLVEHLHHPERQVRERALFELAKLGDCRALDGLLEMMQDEQNAPRRDRAIRALGLLGDPRAARPLIEFVLRSFNLTASEQAAAVALKRICGAHPYVLDDVVPYLIEYVSTDHVSGGAALMLGELSDKRAIEPLSAALASPHFDNWRYGVPALGMIGKRHADAAPYILDTLLRQEPDEILKTISVRFLFEAIAMIGLQHERLAGKVVDTLIDRFLRPGQSADYYRQVPWEALQTLGKIGSRHARTTQTVIDVLSSLLRQPGMSSHAALALAEIRDGRVAEALRQALERDPTQFGNIASALGRQGIIEPLIEMLDWDEMHIAAIIDLGTSGNPRAAEPLINLLASSNYLTRMTAAEALGHLHNPQAVQPLIELFSDRRREVRREAVQALNKIERAHPGAAEPAVSALIALLSDDVRSVQVAVARTLGRIRTSEAQEAVWRWRFPDA